MKEPFIYGNITGHNIQAPYHDNDFEVFVDVSGTTEYYKEFEMNVLNATYDVNWEFQTTPDYHVMILRIEKKLTYQSVLTLHFLDIQEIGR